VKNNTEQFIGGVPDMPGQGSRRTFLARAVRKSRLTIFGGVPLILRRDTSAVVSAIPSICHNIHYAKLLCSSQVQMSASG